LLGKSTSNGKTVHVDASGLLLGRLASLVAKRLLMGDSVTILNAEKAIISGSRRNILEEMQVTLGLRSLSSKKRSPKHPRRPDGIVRRTVAGMLPRDKAKGKEAFERLRVCIGVPEGLDRGVVLSMEKAMKREGGTFMTVGELAQNIGWKPEA